MDHFMNAPKPAQIALQPKPRPAPPQFRGLLLWTCGLILALVLVTTWFSFESPDTSLLLIGGGGLMIFAMLTGIVIAAVHLRQLAQRLQTEANEKEKMIRQLRAAEAHTRAVMDEAADGIITTDGQGIILSFNRAAAHIFGYTPREVLGTNIFTLFVPLPALNRAERIAKLVQTGEAKILGEGDKLQGQRKDGTLFPVEPAVSKIRLPHGRRRYICVVRDLTEPSKYRAALEQEVQERTQKLWDISERWQATSRRLLETQEMERRHLARELHDEVGQTLTAIKMNLLAARREPGPEIAPLLEDGIALIDQIIAQVRSLSLDLRPSMLDDLGLAPALEWYVENQARRLNGTAHLETGLGEARLPAHLETACFRLVQEALSNVGRHARTKEVWVTLRVDGKDLVLEVRDNGAGFDVPTAWQRAARGTSLGLYGMRERVELLGGTIDIQSAPGRGTTVRARLPLGAPPPVE
jgi:two-component system sensor histidine kinase UhpB